MDATTVTRLLAEMNGGDAAAADRLLPLLYEEMRRLAHRRRLQWHGDQTLNTTALVHEAYLRLADQTKVAYESRAHFLAVASRAMRHILIDYAKARRTAKRGGDRPKVSLDDVREALADVLVATDAQADVLLALDEALHRLERLSERQSRIVECRFFGGMTVEETAAALGLSPATVKRDWSMARAWLHREIAGEVAS